MEKESDSGPSNTADGEIASKKLRPLGSRHLQCLLLFLGITIGYANRLCLSIAIVAIEKESRNTGKELDVDSGVILSSFFWGYTILQVPSGYLARVWSAKHVLNLGIFVNGIGSLLLPLANDLGGAKAICACRAIAGLFQACLLPCVHTLLSKWIPPSERGRLASITYAGAQFGTVISYPIAGALVEVAGWRSVFYFFGSAAILWVVGFFLLGSDSPTTASYRPFCGISENERMHIEISLGVSQEKSTEPKKVLKTPWTQIFVSVPFWALIVAHCGQNWGFWMLLTEMPTYMDRMLHFNYAENGWKSALPYLTMLILTVPVSWLSDWSQKKGMSRGLARKLSNTVGHWGPALALLGLCLVPLGDTTLPVVILVAAVGLNVGTLCGFQINHIDLSPNFAGLLMSITNCLASVVSLLAPLIVGLIVTEKIDEGVQLSQWHTVFYISAAIYFMGNLIFILFGSGETQAWNEPAKTEENRGVIYTRDSSSVITLPAVSWRRDSQNYDLKN